MSESQVHSKFKVFVDDVDSDGLSKNVTSQVDSFCADKRVAPKSVGVEYLESGKKLVLSIGYRDDEPGYSCRLTTKPLGRFESLNEEAIANAMSSAAESVKDVICHEFYVLDNGMFVMVLLSRI